MDMTEIQGRSNCKHCGLAVEKAHDKWWHEDGYWACPPAFGTYAEPESDE